MGKNARHNYRSQDFLALIAFMVKNLGWSDKKIASTLGLQLRYFQYIVTNIPELSKAMANARVELISESKQGRRGIGCNADHSANSDVL